MHEELTIRKGRAEDVDAIVAIHLRAFTGFFLSFLGPRFLRQLYAGMLNDDSGVLLVGVAGARINGFVAGTTGPGGFYRRLLERRWWLFAAAVLPRALSTPSIVPRLLRVFGKPAEATALYSGGAALLMSIAVDPSLQSQGIGHKLIGAFCSVCSTRNCKSVCLTTDTFDNEKSNLFYVKCGFTPLQKIQTPEGRWMTLYSVLLAK